MSELPDPLTPSDCDLRGLPFMPLDVVRLGDSDLFALSTGDEFKAAVSLWCKSWLQIPAASLPDDDRILAHLSGTGPRWGKVKEVALRGWIKCSDGRLYHPVVAEKALDAWERRHDAGEARERHADKMRRWRDAKAKKNGGSGGGAVTVTESARDGSRDGHVPSLTGTGTIQGQEYPPKPPLAEADAPAEPSPTRRPVQTGTRLPEQWEPSQASAAFATGLGLDLDEAVAEFSDYWRGVPGAKGRKLDWEGTFRNRCRERAARLRPRLIPIGSTGETAPERRIREQREHLQRLVRGDEDDSPVIDMLPERTMLQ